MKDHSGVDPDLEGPIGGNAQSLAKGFSKKPCSVHLPPMLLFSLPVVLRSLSFFSKNKLQTKIKNKGQKMVHTLFQNCTITQEHLR